MSLFADFINKLENNTATAESTSELVNGLYKYRKLTIEELNQLQQALSKNYSLYSLSLGSMTDANSGSQIGDEGLAILAPALKAHKLLFIFIMMKNLATIITENTVFIKNLAID